MQKKKEKNESRRRKIRRCKETDKEWKKWIYHPDSAKDQGE
jgi:hypothetical protein